MAYDRYDTRDAPRGERSQWRGERPQGWGRGREERFGGDEREDRGFFERAGDEIASWFRDDDDDRRPREGGIRGEREPGSFRREHGRDWERERGSSGREPDEDRGRFWRDRSWESGDFERDDERVRPSGWATRQRESERERERDVGRERGYRPVTGDYGRSEGFFAGGAPRGGFGRVDDDQSRYERSQSPWGRDEYRRTSSAGSREHEREFDPHYQSWRQRQMSELDRDYEEYRRENQSRFEDDFRNWRERRQQKRGLLGQIRENMEVVGNDDERVGTVERVAGDRIILSKSDSESGGGHHSLSCSEIDRVEDDRVILNCSSAEARVRWRDESRNRALFEREDQGEMGPRILDRSFEGTYR